MGNRYVRYAIIAALAVVAWFGGNWLAQLYIELTEYVPKNGIVLVDQNAQEQKENGSVQYPFTSITAAADAARENTDLTTILVRAGEYEEEIVLPDNVSLIAPSRDVTLVTFDDTKTALTTGDNATVYGLVVKGGLYAVLIPPHTSAHLAHAEFLDAERYNISIERDRSNDVVPPPEDEQEEEVKLTRAEKDVQRTKDFETDRFINDDDTLNREALEALHTDLKKVVASHVRVANSDKQGIYVQERWFEIKNSIVEDNDEEGIDLHGNMRAEIVNTISRNNGESGLETQINRNVVLIRDSTFENNGKNGVNVQTGKGYGFISLINNNISGNKKNGVRCALHATRPPRPRPYFETLMEMADNVFINNDKDLGGDCDR